MHISDMVIVAGWITTSSLPGGVAALPPRRRGSLGVLDEDFRFRLLGLVSGVSGVEITRAVGDDEIAGRCGTVGGSGTGPAERRRRRVAGAVGAMTGVTWVGVALGEDDWIVGIP